MVYYVREVQFANFKSQILQPDGSAAKERVKTGYPGHSYHTSLPGIPSCLFEI